MSEIVASEDVPVPHPIQLVVTDDLRRNRLTVFFRLLLGIPLFLWIVLWSLLVVFAVVAAWVVGLVTGRVPDGLHEFIAAYTRYQHPPERVRLDRSRPVPGVHGRTGLPGRPHDRAAGLAEPTDDPLPPDPRDPRRDRRERAPERRVDRRVPRVVLRALHGPDEQGHARPARLLRCATRRRRTATCCSSRSGTRASRTSDPHAGLGRRLPHRRRAVPNRHGRGPAARGRDDPRAAALRARAPRPVPPPARLRAAGPRRHVRLPRRSAERRRRRPRRRLLPQRGLLDRVRARDDRARHLGARRGRRRAARGREPRRRRRALREARDVRDGRGRPRPLGAVPQRAVVRLGRADRGRRTGRRRRVRRRLLRVARGARRARRAAAADRARPRAKGGDRGRATRSSIRSSPSCATSTA